MRCPSPMGWLPTICISILRCTYFSHVNISRVEKLEETKLTRLTHALFRILSLAPKKILL